MEPITNLCILFAVIIIVILVFCNKTIARIKKEQIAKAKKIEEKNLRNWHLFLSSLEAHEKEKIHQLITKKIRISSKLNKFLKPEILKL